MKKTYFKALKRSTHKLEQGKKALKHSTHGHLNRFNRLNCQKYLYRNKRAMTLVWLYIKVFSRVRRPHVQPVQVFKSIQFYVSGLFKSSTVCSGLYNQCFKVKVK